MCDNSCHFEPTFTLNGIPTLVSGCQASVCSGRQKLTCGYPPSLARSQNTRAGILGLTKQARIPPPIWVEEKSRKMNFMTAEEYSICC